MKTKTIEYVPKRDSKGRFARTKRWFKIFFFVLVISPFAYGIVKAQISSNVVSYTAPLQVFAEQPEKTISLEEFNALVKKEQDAIIEELGQCESGSWKKLGFDSPDAMIWFDPDTSGKGVRIASVGYYMFKTQTMQHHYEGLHGKELTQLEAQKVAQTRDEAKEVVRYVVFTLNKGGQEWVNCFKKHNLQAKVDALQEKITWFNTLTN